MSSTDVRPEAAAEEIDIRRMLAGFRRRFRLFAAVAGVVAGAVLGVALVQTPLYTATASLQINTRQAQVVDSRAVLSGLSAETGVVDTEVEVLKSPELAASVVDALNLTADPEFNARLRPTGRMDWVFERLGRKRAAPNAETGLRAERQAVVDAVGRRLSVRRVGLTYSMTVGFTAQDPAKAARVANAFAERYLASQLQAKFDANDQANRFLASRLDDLRGQVEAAEAAVSDYRIANDLLSAQGATLTEQEISAYNQQLATARTQEAEQEARLRTARAQLASGSTGDDVGEALNSPVIRDLRAQRAPISARVADMGGRYGPLHPDLVRARRELADIDAQIEGEIRRLISNLEAQAGVARQRAASVQTSLGAARDALASNSAASVRLRELEGDAQAARAVYQAFLDRYRQTTAQTGVEQADARIISRASIPAAPSSPKLLLYLLLGLVLGGGAGLAAAIIAENLDAGVGTAEDLERRLGLPVLGSIPLAASVVEPADRAVPPIDLVVKRPLSAFAEAFRAMRAAINHSVQGPGGRVVVLTSPLPGEGKTTAAIALARVSAQAGLRVLLLDGDLRRRGATRALGLHGGPGLVEALRGEAALEAVLTRDAASGVQTLTLSNHAPVGEDLFGSAAMDALMIRLRSSFDLILMDAPPVLAVADARTLAARGDAVILLARWRRTPARAVADAARLLHQSGASLLGVALTQVDANAQARQGYGDAGFYYGQYRRYYIG